jgi:hypothetical protein
MKSFDSKIPVSIVAEAFADYIMTNIQIIASQKLCHTCLNIQFNNFNDSTFKHTKTIAPNLLDFQTIYVIQKIHFVN